MHRRSPELPFSLVRQVCFKKCWGETCKPSNRCFWDDRDKTLALTCCQVSASRVGTDAATVSVHQDGTTKLATKLYLSPFGRPIKFPQSFEVGGTVDLIASYADNVETGSRRDRFLKGRVVRLSPEGPTCYLNSDFEAVLDTGDELYHLSVNCGYQRVTKDFELLSEISIQDETKLFVPRVRAALVLADRCMR
jgi:hypothetical protein